MTLSSHLVRLFGIPVWSTGIKTVASASWPLGGQNDHADELSMNVLRYILSCYTQSSCSATTFHTVPTLATLLSIVGVGVIVAIKFGLGGHHSGIPVTM